MQVTRHRHNGVDLEGAGLADGAEGVAQHVDSLVRSQNRATAIGDEGEEESATGNEGASILHGVVSGYAARTRPTRPD